MYSCLPGQPAPQGQVRTPGSILPFLLPIQIAILPAGAFTLRQHDMEVLEFSGIVFGISAAAGFLGSLTGLGGGVVVTPALIFLLGVDLHYAMGASLVSVIATSSGAAAAYVKEGFSNVRVGMFLEIATTVGALVGAAVALHLHVSVIAIIFGLALIYSAFSSLRKKSVDKTDVAPDRIATWLRMDSSYPT